MTTQSIKLFIAIGIVTMCGSLVGWLPDGMSLSPAIAAEREDDHADEEGDEHGDEEGGVLELSKEKLKGLKLNTAKVRKGVLTLTLSLPGEVRWNAEQVAHVVPRVGGVAAEVSAVLGAEVRENDVLAVLDSRELAAAKAGYLAALARQYLAQANFDREQKLWEQQITSEQDYLEAKNSLAEAQIEKRLAERQLHAIGIPDQVIQSLQTAPDNELAVYPIRAPISGVITERHVVRGEMLDNDTELFTVVDVDQVWVMGQAYERDLRFLDLGQSASIRLDSFPGEVFEGKVDYIASQLDLQTRTADIRVVLDNPTKRLRAGMFGVMTVIAGADSDDAPQGLLVPLHALQRYEDGFVVFQPTSPGRFNVVPVRVRDQSKEFAWIEGDLQAGDQVVIGDTFVLKSEAAKKSMGGGHSH